MKIKFLTLNLFEGGKLFDNILKFLDKEKPDILALQEVYDGKDKKLAKNLRSMEVLKQFLNKYHYHFTPELIVVRDEGKIIEGNAIFSKFPILNSSVIFFSHPYGEYDRYPEEGDYAKHPKNMHCCSIKIENKILNACNIHGIWGRDGNDTKDRIKMSKIIVNQIKGKKNVILAGDFNINYNTKTIKNIEKHLISVFKNQLITSFNLKRKDLTASPGYAKAAVDMIFTSPNLEILSKRCPDVDVSDHLPLLCEIDTSNLE